jgi:hypothetical protein
LKLASKTAFVEKLYFVNHDMLKNLFGEQDKYLKLIEKLEPVKIKAWGQSHFHQRP